MALKFISASQISAFSEIKKSLDRFFDFQSNKREHFLNLTKATEQLQKKHTVIYL